MQINIKYPKVKYLDVSDVKELKLELNRLMIVNFVIKKRNNDKTYTDISTIVNTSNINDEIFHLLKNNKHYIFPVTIAQCKV